MEARCVTLNIYIEIHCTYFLRTGLPILKGELRDFRLRRRPVDAVALVEHAAQIGGRLPTFRDSLFVPSLRVNS